MSDQLPEECERLLTDGLKQLQINTTEEQFQTLLDFISLMVKWNSAYNLTAIRDPKEMVIRHLLDSISIKSHTVGKRLLDVGTGPGLPGIPLAILSPSQHFTLLDSNGKKVRFVRQVTLELGLKNVEAVQARVEQFKSEQLFDVITSRAFTELAGMYVKSKHLLTNGGRIVAMKGSINTIVMEKRELTDMKSEIIEIDVPFLKEERHLVILK